MMEMREGARERLNWVHICLVGDGHLRMTGLPSCFVAQWGITWNSQ
jgi:hypothetical protein